MPGAKLFVDANILVYLRDKSSPVKRRQCAAWLAEARSAGFGLVLSYQILREYYAVVARKAAIGQSRTEARRDLAAFRRWLSADPGDHLHEAWRIEDAHGLNFYDCLVVASALNAGASLLLTEDLQHGQRIDGLLIANPFAARLADLGVV